jgi:hypothetical protein
LATSGGHNFSYDGTDTTATSDGTDTFGCDPNGKLLSVGTPSGANLAFTDQHGDVTGLSTATRVQPDRLDRVRPLRPVARQPGHPVRIGLSGWLDRPGNR